MWGFAKSLRQYICHDILLTRQPLPNAFLGHHKRKYKLESNEGTLEQNRFFFSFFFFLPLLHTQKQQLRTHETKSASAENPKK
jgi:hypothetical protein